jgi:hypothetical protein
MIWLDEGSAAAETLGIKEFVQVIPRQIRQIKKILASDRHCLLIIKFIVLKTILSMAKIQFFSVLTTKSLIFRE